MLLLKSQSLEELAELLLRSLDLQGANEKWQSTANKIGSTCELTTKLVSQREQLPQIQKN